MGLSIPQDCYIYLDSKYRGLINNICRNITGDPAVTSYHEDVSQELRIKCIEAVHAYSKKINEPNFELFIKTKSFDQYIKTCLWNLKNSTGSNIVKNKAIYKTVALDASPSQIDEQYIDNSVKGLEGSLFLTDLKLITSKTLMSIINYVVSDPSLIKPSGKINIAKLSKTMDMPWRDVNKRVKELEQILDRS